MAEGLNVLVNKLEKLVNRLENVVVRADRGGADDEEISLSVLSFDEEILGGKFKLYLNLSQKLGGDIYTHSKLVEEVFCRLRAVLVQESRFKYPTPDMMTKLMSPLSEQVVVVQSFVDKNRSSNNYNALMTISQMIPCVGWVAVPKPALYIKDTRDQAQFYNNRVVKEYKGKSEDHVSWARSVMAICNELENYVKNHHSIGLVFNSQGEVYNGVDSAQASPAAGPLPPSGGGPPPPPPPPVILPPPIDGAPAESGSSAKAELFASLNKGVDVSKGLKKVSDDMKTHKNPALRAQGSTPNKPTPLPKPKESLPAKPIAKPPKCELVGKKWVVENQSNNQNVVIKDTTHQQTVYIYKCENSTMVISGKLNSIVLDNCKKCGLVFDDVISSVDFVNCQRIKAQVTGKVPTVNIDKTDGIEVYLSSASLDTEIVSAKSSEMNVLVPKADGEYTEFALPEQYKSKWNGKSFSTSPADSNE